MTIPQYLEAAKTQGWTVDESRDGKGRWHIHSNLRYPYTAKLELAGPLNQSQLVLHVSGFAEVHVDFGARPPKSLEIRVAAAPPAHTIFGTSPTGGRQFPVHLGDAGSALSVLGEGFNSAQVFGSIATCQLSGWTGNEIVLVDAACTLHQPGDGSGLSLTSRGLAYVSTARRVEHCESHGNLWIAGSPSAGGDSPFDHAKIEGTGSLRIDSTHADIAECSVDFAGTVAVDGSIAGGRWTVGEAGLDDGTTSGWLVVSGSIRDAAAVEAPQIRASSFESTACISTIENDGSVAIGTLGRNRLDPLFSSNVARLSVTIPESLQNDSLQGTITNSSMRANGRIQTHTISGGAVSTSGSITAETIEHASKVHVGELRVGTIANVRQCEVETIACISKSITKCGSFSSPHLESPDVDGVEHLAVGHLQVPGSLVATRVTAATCDIGSTNVDNFLLSEDGTIDSIAPRQSQRAIALDRTQMTWAPVGNRRFSVRDARVELEVTSCGVEPEDFEAHIPQVDIGERFSGTLSITSRSALTIDPEKADIEKLVLGENSVLTLVVPSTNDDLRGFGTAWGEPEPQIHEVRSEQGSAIRVRTSGSEVGRKGSTVRVGLIRSKKDAPLSILADLTVEIALGNGALADLPGSGRIASSPIAAVGPIVLNTYGDLTGFHATEDANGRIPSLNVVKGRVIGAGGDFELGMLGGQLIGDEEILARIRVNDERSPDPGTFTGQLVNVDPTRATPREIRSLADLEVFEPNPAAVRIWAKEAVVDPSERQTRSQVALALAKSVRSRNTSGRAVSAVLWANAELLRRTTHGIEKVGRTIHKAFGYGYRPLPPALTYIAVCAVAALLSGRHRKASNWLHLGKPDNPGAVVAAFFNLATKPYAIADLAGGDSAWSVVWHWAAPFLHFGAVAAAVFFAIAIRRYLSSAADPGSI